MVVIFISSLLQTAREHKAAQTQIAGEKRKCRETDQKVERCHLWLPEKKIMNITNETT